MININNFHECFFDIKKHKPKKGQVLARYTARADFIAGDDKKTVIKLLTGNIHSALQFMKNVLYFNEKSAVLVAKTMLQDLQILTTEEVLKKEYSFDLEAYYWTNKEYIPEDDLHWDYLKIESTDQHSSLLKLIDMNSCNAL